MLNRFLRDGGRRHRPCLDFNVSFHFSLKRLSVYEIFYEKCTAGWEAVKTTRYFEEQVLRKRPYIKREWCERALREPVRREAQPDGRMRYWILIPELKRYLRVVTLEDSMTVHNAFLDRGFKEDES